MLGKIERELVSNQERLGEIEYQLREDYDPVLCDAVQHEFIEIEKHNKVLELKRKFILDKRNGWKQRIIFSLIVPAIVSIVVAIASKYL